MARHLCFSNLGCNCYRTLCFCFLKCLKVSFFIVMWLHLSWALCDWFLMCWNLIDTCENSHCEVGFCLVGSECFLRGSKFRWKENCFPFINIYGVNFTFRCTCTTPPVAKGGRIRVWKLWSTMIKYWDRVQMDFTKSRVAYIFVFLTYPPIVLRNGWKGPAQSHNVSLLLCYC